MFITNTLLIYIKLQNKIIYKREGFIIDLKFVSEFKIDSKPIDYSKQLLKKENLVESTIYGASEGGHEYSYYKTENGDYESISETYTALPTGRFQPKGGKEVTITKYDSETYKTTTTKKYDSNFDGNYEKTTEKASTNYLAKIGDLISSTFLKKHKLNDINI